MLTSACASTPPVSSGRNTRDICVGLKYNVTTFLFIFSKRGSNRSSQARPSCVIWPLSFIFTEIRISPSLLLDFFALKLSPYSPRDESGEIFEFSKGQPLRENASNASLSSPYSYEYIEQTFADITRLKTAARDISQHICVIARAIFFDDV